MTSPSPQDTTTALTALETRVRDTTSTQVDQATSTINPVLLAAVTAAGVYTASQILSQPAVHRAITAALSALQVAILALISAAYRASAELGRAQAAAELGDEQPLPGYLGPTLDTLLGDVRTAVSDAQGALVRDVAAAHDGVTGDNPTPARVLTVNQALQRTMDRLQFRLTATGVTAAHQGATDTQNALYAGHAAAHPGEELIQEWVVTSADPCPFCAALHGTTITPGGLFNATAGTVAGKRPLPTWGPLTGPPRHPNCRCRITIRVKDPNTPQK